MSFLILNVGIFIISFSNFMKKQAFSLNLDELDSCLFEHYSCSKMNHKSGLVAMRDTSVC